MNSFGKLETYQQVQPLIVHSHRYGGGGGREKWRVKEREKQAANQEKRGTKRTEEKGVKFKRKGQIAFCMQTSLPLS